MKYITTLLLALAFMVTTSACVDDDQDPSHGQDLSTSYDYDTCHDLGYDHGFRVDAWDGDGIKMIDGVNSIAISWDVYGGTMDWSSTLGIDAVIMKGGFSTKTYEYDPEAFSDSNLHTPYSHYHHRFYKIRHVEFCYDYELTVEKTAHTKFKRTWDWDIAKSVDHVLHELFFGDTAVSTYTVTVTNNGYVDSGFAAKGQVIIRNETPKLANLKEVVDKLSNGVYVPLHCDRALPATLSPGDVVTCTYHIDFDGPVHLVNKAYAKVTYHSPVQGGSAHAVIDFDQAYIHKVNHTVHVTDNFEGEITDLGAVSASHEFTYDREFTCEAVGTNNNTATLVETAASDSVNVVVECRPRGRQGCTPGYWKNHLDAWPPTGYSPHDTVVSVFAEAAPYVSQMMTLLDALQGGGGPTVADAARILLRASVASLLDAAHPDVAYPLSIAEVISMTNDALATGNRREILHTKDFLDRKNNLGCPL